MCWKSKLIKYGYCSYLVKLNKLWVLNVQNYQGLVCGLTKLAHFPLTDCIVSHGRSCYCTTENYYHNYLVHTIFWYIMVFWKWTIFCSKSIFEHNEYNSNVVENCGDDLSVCQLIHLTFEEHDYAVMLLYFKCYPLFLMCFITTSLCRLLFRTLLVFLKVRNDWCRWL